MLDGILRQSKKTRELDYALTRFVLKHKNSSVLFSKKYGQVRSFTTRDSGLYFSQQELLKVRQGAKIDFTTGRLDCAFSRQKEKTCLIFSRKKEDKLYLDLKERYSNLGLFFKDVLKNYTNGVSMLRMWNLSLIGSLIFGMFLMTMIYRYLGPGARAAVEESRIQNEMVELAKKQEAEKVLGESIAKAQADRESQIKASVEIEKKQAEEAIFKQQKEFELKIRELVKGYPIEKMAPYIAKEDPLVAAFFIAIAKKESSWGEHVPVSGGADCYNYVGFRLKTKEMGSGGHSCFSSPKEGFEVTVKRIKSLIYNEDMTTAKKMVNPWKCGYDCSWDSKEAVQKWVSDVDYYLKQVLAWKIKMEK
jgi:hypothetical protein